MKKIAISVATLVVSLFILFTLTSSNIFKPSMIDADVVASISQQQPMVRNIYILPLHVTRMDVNAIVAKNKDFWILRYGEYIGSEKVATSIINYSLEFDVPVNFAFALGNAESKLDEKAPPNYNGKSSFDYGIFRLNSKSYPDIKKYSEVDANCRQGILHLKEKYLQYGNYEVAAMMYNCGKPTNVGKTTVDHLTRILGYEKDFDEWFNNIYRDKISRAFGVDKVQEASFSSITGF